MSSLSTKYLRNEGGSPLSLSLSAQTPPQAQQKENKRELNTLREARFS